MSDLIDRNLPSAETHEERTETHACDLISRQAAIGIERNATVDTNPMHFEAHQKFTQFMDDAEISSFGRWQWSNGFNTALTAVGIDLKKLPSAQPYSEADIQKMQDLEQAEIQKAYELGKLDAEQRWIPCSERLPQWHWINPEADVDERIWDGDRVIVCGRELEWPYTGIACAMYGPYGWEIYDECFDLDDEPIAWKPLPEPYREEL